MKKDIKKIKNQSTTINTVSRQEGIIKNNMKNLKDLRSSGTFSHKNILENKKNGINSNIKIIKNDFKKKYI